MYNVITMMAFVVIALLHKYPPSIGTSEKTSTIASTPPTVSTDTPTPVNEDTSDEVIRKNRERMMKKMAGKSPKATSAGFVFLISSRLLFEIIYNKRL